MHKERLWICDFHHLFIDHPVSKISNARLVLSLKAHRCPDIGGDEIGPLGRLHGIIELLKVPIGDQPCALDLDLIARWRGDTDLKIENLSGLQPGVTDVVGVANPGHRLAFDGASMFDKGKNVCKNLAGVILVSKPIDDGHPGQGRKPFDNGLLEGTNHDKITHARDDLGCVFHRLTSTELGVAGIQINRSATQLVHSRLKG